MLGVNQLIGFSVGAVGAPVAPTTGFYALVYLLADLVYSPSTTIDPEWDAEVSDAQGVHSNSVDPERFTIPSDWNGRYVRLQGNFNASSVADSMEIWGKKNGSTFAGSGRMDGADTAGNDSINIMSAPVVIATSDYLVWEADLSSAGTLLTGSPAGAKTWAQIELMDASYSGTLVNKTGNQALSAGTDTVVTFDNEVYDPDARHDNSTNNTRINAVSGDALVRLSAGLASASATGQFILQMRKSTGGGGAVAVIGMPRIETDTAGGDYVTGMSAPIAFSSASSDYVEAMVFHTSAVNLLTSDHTWFCVERLPSSLKYCLAYRNANQALGAGVATIVNWNTEVADTDSWHSLAATVTVTIATPGVVTWTGHTFLAGSPIVLSTSGALPTGLTAGTIYYVVNPASNTFQLATAPGGSAINTTGSQSGVHTATNSSRMTVPSGVSRVRVGFNITTEASMTGQFIGRILKNGADFIGAGYAETDTSGADAIGAWSAILEVTPGDYFETEANAAASANIGTAVTSWMSIEEVPDAT
jgi:hypothetical protein